MGQYYYIVNLDKKQYLHPHKFGDGLKLLEFGCSQDSTMTGLAVLLADGNNRGRGDLRSDNPIIGSWAGDRIVVAGDYADAWKFIPKKLKKQLYIKCLEEQLSRKDIKPSVAKKYAKQNCNLHTLAYYFFEDISEKVIEALKNDPYLKKALEKNKVFKPMRPDTIITIAK